MARGDDDGTIERYRLEGVVVRRDVAHKIVTIKHGPIKNDSGRVELPARFFEAQPASELRLPWRLPPLSSARSARSARIKR